jgi:hypothetical protein
MRFAVTRPSRKLLKTPRIPIAFHAHAQIAFSTCRQNQGPRLTVGQTKREPDYWLGDDRHKDGVTLLQAIERNIGTCHRDAKGEA